MGRKIVALPAEEIEIAFQDKVFLASFNMRAVGYMQEVLMKPSGGERLNLIEFGSLILYGAIKANHEDFTLEEARALAVTIRPKDLNEILDLYMESMGGQDEIFDEAKKKIFMNMLMNLAAVNSNESS